MKKTYHFPVPIIMALKKLGQDIKNARRRRRIPLKIMEERTGISRSTLTKIEKGEATPSIGSYALVLFVLGMADRLKNMAEFSQDTLGMSLENEDLPKRIRLPRSSEDKES